MKDPAFLFYSADYLVGVLGMSFEDQGKYMFILANMHQKGRMKEETIRFLVGSISDDLKEKFCIDENQKWYSNRLETEISNRKRFTDSRRANGQKGGRKSKKTDDDDDNVSNDSEPKNPISPSPNSTGFDTEMKPSEKPNEKPYGLGLGYPTDNLTINVIEIINVIDKIENKNLAAKILELFKTKKWRHKNVQALNETIQKCLKYDSEFMVKQIENAIIGEWNGLFYDNTDSEHSKFLASQSPLNNKTKKGKINIDQINYGGNKN